MVYRGPHNYTTQTETLMLQGIKISGTFMMTSIDANTAICVRQNKSIIFTKMILSSSIYLLPTADVQGEDVESKETHDKAYDSYRFNSTFQESILYCFMTNWKYNHNYCNFEKDVKKCDILTFFKFSFKCFFRMCYSWTFNVVTFLQVAWSWLQTIICFENDLVCARMCMTNGPWDILAFNKLK